MIAEGIVLLLAVQAIDQRYTWFDAKLAGAKASTVELARWVLRGTALGNKCRLPDRTELEQPVRAEYLVATELTD